MGEVRDFARRTEDTEVFRVPAATARDVRRTRRAVPLVAVGLAVVAVAFFVLPLVGLLKRAPWGSLWDDLTTPQARDAIRLSVECSLWATALSVLFGVPLAWVLARTRFPGRSLVRALVVLPMVLPPVVGGVALLFTFQRNGGLMGEWLYDWFGLQLTFTTAGAVLAETFVAMPFLVITVEAGLRQVDERYEDAAASLGAGRWTVFRRVTLPLVAPALYAGAALAWARALGEFGATITFAGNIQGRTQTVPLAVYLFLESDQGIAIALSLVLLAVSVIVLVALRDRWFGGLRDAPS
jgi:molybdate transport system permease protein